MKNLIMLSTLYVLMALQLQAQGHDWEMSIYAEDAVGNRDTVTMFFDLDHVPGNGEVIDPSPFDTVFDVRLRDPDLYYFESSIKYKKMHFASWEGEWNTTGFGSNMATLMVHAQHPPVTFTYDSTKLGYPSFVNLLWLRTDAPFVVQYWYKNDHTYNTLSGEVADAFPDYYCMMRRSQITENFELFNFFNERPGGWIPDFSTQVILSTGDTTLIPGFYLSNFGSWLDDYYCDKHASIGDGQVEVSPIRLSSSIGARSIYIEGPLDAIGSYSIYDIGGKLHFQADGLQEHWLELDMLPSGMYIIQLDTKEYGLLSDLFVLME